MGTKRWGRRSLSALSIVVTAAVLGTLAQVMAGPAVALAEPVASTPPVLPKPLVGGIVKTCGS
jgi:hypothetical protein